MAAPLMAPKGGEKEELRMGNRGEGGRVVDGLFQQPFVSRWNQSPDSLVHINSQHSDATADDQNAQSTIVIFASYRSANGNLF